MIPLSSDASFHFELLRTLGAARYAGADIAEVLTAAAVITPGDFESWYQAFYHLAERVKSSIRPDDAARYPVSVRDAMFRAATYYRAADFFLHGNPADPRIDSLWAEQRACFDVAISLLPIPGQRVKIQADGFVVPAIFYRASRDGVPRPTVLFCNGFDGAQEEMLHQNGFAALERGFHVLTYEGPGQPTVRREQKIGFIGDWERVVTPVVDYCETVPEIDHRKLVLFGNSFGGFLVPRAAAFEQRVAAVVCVDGIFDVYQGFTQQMPPDMRATVQSGQTAELQENLPHMLPHMPTSMRWGIEQMEWSFMLPVFEALEMTRTMTMKNIAGQLKCPVLVCEAEEDQFFKGQPELLIRALGKRATYVKFTTEEGAGNHCHVGASAKMNQVVFGWVQDVLDGVSPAEAMVV